MTFVANSSGEDAEASFSFELMEKAPSIAPTDSLMIERYQLKPGSKMTIDGKEVPLFCTTALTGHSSKDDQKIVQINLLANFDACRAKDITLYSNAGVEFVYDTKKKSQVSNLKFHYRQKSFLAKQKKN